MLKNARTEYQDEAEEIANYRAIEALAKAVGDKETAKLAREIGREEKKMADFLVGIIDELALDVVHDEVPVAEIGAAPAARRTASRSRADAAHARRRTTLARRRPSPRSRGEGHDRARGRQAGVPRHGQAGHAVERQARHAREVREPQRPPGAGSGRVRARPGRARRRRRAGRSSAPHRSHVRWRGDLAAAVAVADDARAARLRRVVAVAPLQQRHHRSATGRCPCRSGGTRSARGAPGSGTRSSMPSSTRRSRRSVSTLRATPRLRWKSSKRRTPHERVAHDEERPAVAEHLEGAGDRAVLVVVGAGQHGWFALLAAGPSTGRRSV